MTTKHDFDAIFGLAQHLLAAQPMPVIIRKQILVVALMLALGSVVSSCAASRDTPETIAGGQSDGIDSDVYRTRDLDGLVDFIALDSNGAPVAEATPDQNVSAHGPNDAKAPTDFVLALLQTLRRPALLGVAKETANEADDLLDRISPRKQIDGRTLWGAALNSGSGITTLLQNGDDDNVTMQATQ